MKLTLETDRLLIKPLHVDDVDMGVEVWSDPDVMRYAGGAHPREEIISGISDACMRSGGGCIGVWCVIEKKSNEKLGSVVLLPLPIEVDDTDWSLLGLPEIPDGEIEIGYLFKPAAWGKGYATETCRRLLQFAFTETPLEKIVAVTDLENAPSRHVLEKCGLSYRGLRRAYASDDNTDYQITKSEWQALTTKRPSAT